LNLQVTVRLGTRSTDDDDDGDDELPSFATTAPREQHERRTTMRGTRRAAVAGTARNTNNGRFVFVVATRSVDLPDW
jgi:hypothetical protein